MEWWRLAISQSIRTRATKVAIVVGIVLIVINHGDAIVRGEFSRGRIARIVLTVLVPYCVSTYSSVEALRERPKVQITE